MFVAMVIELQNIAFAGRLDNPDALAAVGLANMMINIFGLSFSFGMNTALETLAAQAVGAENYEKAG